MRCLRSVPAYLLILVSMLVSLPAAYGAVAKKPAQPKKPTPPAAVKAPAVTEVTAATAGKPYSYPIHLAIGSPTATTPFTLAVGSGALPACLQMTTDGVLSGSPDAKCVGTYRFVVYITSFNGEQASGSYLIHVNAGSDDDKSTDASPSDQPQTVEAVAPPDCGLVITSVLSDGATQIKGNVNKDVVDEDSLIAFCRSRSGDPRACLVGRAGSVGKTLFEPLAGDAGYYVSPTTKSGTFSATLLVPLDYGDSLNAVLVKHKQCVEKPFGVEAEKPAADSVKPDTGTTPKDKKTKTAATPLNKPTPKDKPKPAKQLPPKSQTTTTSPRASRETVTPTAQASSLAHTSSDRDGTQPRAFLVSAPVAVRAFSQTADGVAASSAPGALQAAAASPQAPPSGAAPAPNADAPPGAYPSDLPISPSVPVNSLSLPEDGNAMHPPVEDSIHPIFAPASPTVAVLPGADWGRIRATFVLGILLANDSSQLSSAHQFYDFLVEKYWSLPGCYRPGSAKAGRECLDDQDQSTATSWLKRHYPGVNTYFETRMTAIPISSNPSTNAAGAGTTTTTSVRKYAGAGATTTTSSSGTFLTTQKTARVAVGADLPFLITRWEWRRRPNALFLAPLGKTGFDTLTGSLSQTIVAPDGGSTTATYERLYNYYAFGGRIGHYTLSHSQDSAPEWQSFLDVVVGRFSNLQSYICEPARRKPGSFTAISGSQCANAYGGAAGDYVDSLKRPYRLDFEGALKVPYVPMLMGFNANLGQHAISTGHIDPAFNTPDDLRFLFGTKFDVASFLNKLGLPGLGK